jgi:hypothetical protein
LSMWYLWMANEFRVCLGAGGESPVPVFPHGFWFSFIGTASSTPWPPTSPILLKCIDCVYPYRLFPVLLTWLLGYTAILPRHHSLTLPTWCTPRTHPPIAPPGRGQHLVPCRYSVFRVFQPVTFPPCGSWPMLCLGGEQTTAWVCGLDEALHRATYMLSLATHAKSGDGSRLGSRPVVMHGLATAWVL